MLIPALAGCQSGGPGTPGGVGGSGGGNSGSPGAGGSGGGGASSGGSGGSTGGTPVAGTGGTSGAGAGGNGGTGSGGSAGGAGGTTAPDAGDPQGGSGGSGPATGGRTVTVTAGQFDRDRTPVAIALGAEAAGKVLALRDAAGARLPLQADAEGRAVFVLPALKAGASASFTIDGTLEAPAGVEARKGDDHVEVAVGPAVLFRYQMQGKLPRGRGPELPARRLRPSDVHPDRRAGDRRLSRRSPPSPRHLVGLGPHRRSPGGPSTSGTWAVARRRWTSMR